MYSERQSLLEYEKSAALNVEWFLPSGVGVELNGLMNAVHPRRAPINVSTLYSAARIFFFQTPDHNPTHSDPGPPGMFLGILRPVIIT